MLTSSRERKETLVQRILERSPVDEGLICVLSCVEPCTTFNLFRSRETKRREFRRQPGKCQHLYHDFLHPRFGLMHVRLQTWFPFTVQVCMNGREWLAREMTKSCIRFVKEDNCFPHVDDPLRAQRLLAKQVHVDWPHVLDRLALEVNPALPSILRRDDPHHYWCAHQLEWATDVLFVDHQSLAAVYQPLVQHAMTRFSCADVMRFLGRKASHAFLGEVTSDFKNRVEGIPVMHRAGRNSVKTYDKNGSILRVETTINAPTELRAPRPKGESGELVVQPVRKTVADLERLTEIGQRANERYLDALAEMHQDASLHEVIAPICKHATFRGRRVRALRPWDSDDLALFQAIADGAFVLRGFTNRDLVNRLYQKPAADDSDRRQRRSRTSRQLRLLRAHGVIRKLPKQNRYQLTDKGRRIVTAILAARDTPVSALLHAA
ncbi:MAG: hypothetical protein IPM29_02565 [Planctomycetes bacterium]|nr:hypothetical protein [Planctomycetota bacterium]